MNRILIILTFSFLLCTSCDVLLQVNKPITPPPKSGWLEKWLEEPSCKPPCWEGIIPGQTTLDDAYLILNNLPEVKVTYEKFYNGATKQTEWEIGGDSGYGIATSERNSEIINNVSISVKEDILILEEILFVYGQPAYVIFESCRMPEFTAFCDVYLVYPDKKLVLNMYFFDEYDEQSHNIDIKPESRVDELLFFAPGNVDTSKKKVLEWAGYGIYKYEP